ncbi:hypothetical protein DL240_08530 [Lujinxingia litoralis]|uniref:TonB C-terminal domain-containing protein n=1 Tax=Lujinxingia litoralis TaxID=2211119 RepID=A0A328C7Y1_9DELT|nr:AgmX/PglI C-terminal domain-containing protein [Lujinxingia litoralis]RAL22928.1 hypothetical protein DL240_08530 [Lujinxingia litoralis]
MMNEAMDWPRSVCRYGASIVVCMMLIGQASWSMASPPDEPGSPVENEGVTEPRETPAEQASDNASQPRRLLSDAEWDAAHSGDMLELPSCEEEARLSNDSFDDKLLFRLEIEVDGEVSRVELLRGPAEPSELRTCLNASLLGLRFGALEVSAYVLIENVRRSDGTRLSRRATAPYSSDRREVIQRVVRQHRREMQHCYEHELRHQPDLAGSVTVRWTIAPSGAATQVSIVETSLNNSELEQCMVQNIRRWVFPKPKGGGIVKVIYPFNFSF